MQRAAILPYAISLIPPHFLILYWYYIINSAIIRKKLLNTKYVFRFSLQIFFEIFPILRKIQRHIVVNVSTFLCKVSIILFEFLSNLNFVDGYSKKSQISSLIKTRLIGPELFHADRRTERQADWQTDGHEGNIAFCNFANAPRHARKAVVTFLSKPGPWGKSNSSEPCYFLLSESMEQISGTYGQNFRADGRMFQKWLSWTFACV